MSSPDIGAALTDNQARLLTALYHKHGPLIPEHALALDTAVEHGTLGSLVSDDILARLGADDLALLSDFIDYHDTETLFFSAPSAVQQYEADIPAYTPDRFARLHESGALYRQGNVTVTTSVGEDLLDHEPVEDVYTLTMQGRAMLADAPLPYRHPDLFDAYTDLKQEGDPHDCIITVSGGRATGTSSHAADLADVSDLAYSDSGAWYREVADELGMPVQMLRRNRRWVEYMEGRNFDIENDAHTYEVAGRGVPVVIEGRLAGPALAADRGDGNPIAPIRIKITCDDAVRAARYAIREDISEADTPAEVTPAEQENALEQIQEEDDAIYDAFAETYAGIDPRRDTYYTHTVDNSGMYEAVQEELQSLLRESGLLD